MRHYSILLLLNCFLPLSLGAQTDLNIDQNLNDIFFVDSQSGWVIGDSGFIAHSSDGGASWTKQVAGNISNLNKLTFVDNLNGWAAGDSGTFLSTSDGGTNWVEMPKATDNDIIDIEFVSTTHGWFIDGNYPFLTTDGGNSWTQKGQAYFEEDLIGITAIDTANAWIIAGDQIYYTVDKGESFLIYWAAVLVDPAWGELLDITMYNDSTGWALGQICNDGTTTCSPAVWTPLSADDDWWYTDLEPISNSILNATLMVDTLIGWVVGDNGAVLKTVDAGSSWVEQESGVINRFTSLSFVDVSTGWILGDNNVILSTTDGGVNWQTLISVDKDDYYSPKGFNLSQNHPNPFNPVTTISYSLPLSGDVSLIIYDILGKEITRLVDGYQQAGEYQTQWNASNVSSGIYFYRLHTDNFAKTKKMVVLK